MELFNQYRKVQIQPAYLLLLLLPILVLTTSEMLLNFYSDPNLTVPTPDDVQYDALKELTGRYKFLASFLFYVVVGATLTLIFLGELIVRHSKRSMLFTAGGFVFALVVTMVFSKLEPAGLGSFEAYELIGTPLLHEALADAKAQICTGEVLGVASCGDMGAFYIMDTLTETTNDIAGVTSVCIVLGMILALARPVGGPGTPEAKVRALHYSQGVVRRYLYFAGLLLSAGMLMNIAWMSWPTAMITDGELRKTHAELVRSISLYRGVSYSLLILSYYMPVSLILMLKIETLRGDANEEASHGIGDALARFKLEDVSSIEALKAILAILSPLLAAVASGGGAFIDPSKFL